MNKQEKKLFKELEDLKDHYSDYVDELQKENKALKKDLSRYSSGEHITSALKGIESDTTAMVIGIWVGGFSWLLITVGKLKGWW